MYSFFVLGQIPGTSIIINFWMWLEMAALLFTLLVWMAYRRHIELVNYIHPTISSEQPKALQQVTAQ